MKMIVDLKVLVPGGGVESFALSINYCQHITLSTFLILRKQPSKVVPRKKCSENMQQTYRIMWWNFLCNFIKITLWHGCSAVDLLHIFSTPFPNNTYRWLLLILYHLVKAFMTHTRNSDLFSNADWFFQIFFLSKFSIWLVASCAKNTNLEVYCSFQK